MHVEAFITLSRLQTDYSDAQCSFYNCVVIIVCWMGTTIDLSVALIRLISQFSKPFTSTELTGLCISELLALKTEINAGVGGSPAIIRLLLNEGHSCGA